MAKKWTEITIAHRHHGDRWLDNGERLLSLMDNMKVDSYKTERDYYHSRTIWR